MPESGEKIKMELSVEELEQWNESWLQPGLLSVKLQRQLLINRMLTVCLFIATATMMLATWHSVSVCHL